DLDRFDVRALQRLDGVLRDLLARLDRELAAGHLDLGRRAQPDEAVGDGPVDLAPLDVELVDVVERPDDLVRPAQAERAQEDGREELALPVDAHVQQVLRVVLELDPRSAIRDDLRDVERLVFRMKERARGAVQLADDDALGAVDDEGAVLRHQRDVAEVDLLLLDVADGLHAGVVVLVPSHGADRDLQRHGARHAALLALFDVVLQLQADGVAADVADVAARLVRLAAARAQDLAVAVRIGDQRRAAVAARLPQVVQPLQLAALELPVADRVLDELERGVLAEVADREDRLEHRLQTRVLALARQTVHLQEAFVGLLLDLDQVRNRDGGLDFRKIDALAVDVLGKTVHSVDLERRRSAAAKPAGRSARAAGTGRRRAPAPLHATHYLISTLAPTSSNFFLIASASSFGTPSLIGFGAPSTR